MPIMHSCRYQTGLVLEYAVLTDAARHSRLQRKSGRMACPGSIRTPHMLMFPYDAAGTSQIDKLEVVHTLLVPYKGKGTLQSSIRPFVRIWVSVVDASERGGEDLVGRGIDRGLDFRFLVVG